MKLHDYVNSRLNRVRGVKALSTLNHILNYPNIEPLVYWSDRDGTKPVLFVSSSLVKLYPFNGDKNTDNLTEILRYIEYQFPKTVQLFINAGLHGENPPDLEPEPKNDDDAMDSLRYSLQHESITHLANASYDTPMQRTRDYYESIDFKPEFPNLFKELQQFNYQSLIDHALDTKNYELLKELI